MCEYLKIFNYSFSLFQSMQCELLIDFKTILKIEIRVLKVAKFVSGV